MLNNPALPALAKICLTFALMLFAIHKNWGLWLAIFGGGVILALLFGLSPVEVGAAIAGTFPQASFLTLFSVVACIMLLSEIQNASGQGRRLVNGLTPYMRSPCLRLMFFPALVGLLPMPGGAIFSCPMVRDVAHGFDMPERQKVLINYWFRHIWESAWPLYPGYILACSLANIPPSLLWHFTFPIVIISVSVGWVILLRFPIKNLAGAEKDETEKRPLFSVLMEALPIIVAIGCAPLFEALFDLAGLKLPNGASFVCSFLTASATAMLQNKMTPADLPKLFLKRHIAKMLILIVAIFMFKELVIAAKVVDSLASIASGKSALLLLFIFLPAAMGLLTGLMLGFVGAAFPLLLGLLSQAGLYEERLCWVILSLCAGHFGQMISPLHSCYLVTTEFFKVPLPSTYRAAFAAALCQLLLSAGYAAALYFLLYPLL